MRISKISTFVKFLNKKFNSIDFIVIKKTINSIIWIWKLPKRIIWQEPLPWDIQSHKTKFNATNTTAAVIWKTENANVGVQNTFLLAFNCLLFNICFELLSIEKQWTWLKWFNYMIVKLEHGSTKGSNLSTNVTYKKLTFYLVEVSF